MLPESINSRVPADGSVGHTSTRERILAAARQIIVEEGYDRLSLERVAERAVVARATIYNQFGSKSGLLEGLLKAIEHDARVHESREYDHSVGQLLARVTQIWDAEGDVLRSLLAMSVVDPQVRQVVHRHQRGRRQRIAELVEELDNAGQLHVEQDDAVDLLWLLTSFHAYDFLRQGAQRNGDDARTLLQILAANLIDATG